MSAQQSLFTQKQLGKQVRKTTVINPYHTVLFGPLKGMSIADAISANVQSVQWYLKRLAQPVTSEVQQLINRQLFYST